MTGTSQPSRLALFAPVPPAASGIADYVADLVPLLLPDWNVEVFTPTASPSPLQGCPTHPVEAWDERAAAEPYDLNVYQIGNDIAHSAVISRALATPGLLVLHDTVLHPARVAAHLRDGDLDGYRQMAASTSASGTSLGHLVAAGLGSAAMYWRFPMCEDLVRGSRLTVVHGETLAGWLRALVPGAAISVVTHWRSVAPVQATRVQAWRRRLGAEERPLVGTFGHLGPAHGIGDFIEALGRLPRDLEWAAVLVGHCDPVLGIDDALSRMKLSDRVHCVGAVSREDFSALLHAVDMAVNVRYPTARSSSGTLQQLMALGTPVVISDLIHLRDLPDAAVARIPPTSDVAGNIAAALHTWLEDSDARAAAGNAARAWALREASAEGMASSYGNAIRRAIAAPAPRTTTAAGG